MLQRAMTSWGDTTLPTLPHGISNQPMITPETTMPDATKAPVALILLHGIEVPGSPEAMARSWEESNQVLAA